MQLDLLNELKNMVNPHADEHRLQQDNSVKNATKQKSTSKLQWRGNTNQLITFFYDTSKVVSYEGNPLLIASKKQITDLLINNFIDKDGNEISKATIDTIFTPSKEDKRPPEHKRIKIPV